MARVTITVGLMFVDGTRLNRFTLIVIAPPRARPLIRTARVNQNFDHRVSISENRHAHAYAFPFSLVIAHPKFAFWIKYRIFRYFAHARKRKKKIDAIFYRVDAACHTLTPDALISISR